MNPHLLVAAAKVLEYLKKSCPLKTSVHEVESRLFGSRLGFMINATADGYPMEVMIYTRADDTVDIVVIYGEDVGNPGTSFAEVENVDGEEVTVELIEELVETAIRKQVSYYNGEVEGLKQALRDSESELEFHRDQLSTLRAQQEPSFEQTFANTIKALAMSTGKTEDEVLDMVTGYGKRAQEGDDL